MKYELTIITPGEQSVSEAAASVATVSKILETNGVTQLTNRDWGRRDLAYPINKQLSGYYTTYEFESSGQNISAIERALRLNKTILRWLTVTAYAEPVSLAEPVKTAVPSTARSAEESLRRSSSASARPTPKKKPVAKVTIDEEELEEKVDAALHKMLEGEDNKTTIDN